MSNEITKIVPEAAQGIALTPKGQIVLRSVGEAAGFAQLMASSGMLPPKVTAPSAVVAIVAGACLGLNPFESVQSIAVINNRPSLFGDGLKAVVQGSGVWESEEVKWFTDPNGSGRRVAVRVTVKRKGVTTPIVGEFSEKMAQQAGLLGKQGPWQQYPERMLLARARAFAYRDGFADVLKGVRSAEEEMDAIDVEELEPRPADPAPRKRIARRATAAEIVAKQPSAPNGDAATPTAGPEKVDAGDGFYPDQEPPVEAYVEQQSPQGDDFLK